ncbi:MAG: hypothetical protein LUD07_05005 [Clostridiales bacterium]|nr:hypothetical protein [Clostridiales bacterium]
MLKILQRKTGIFANNIVADGIFVKCFGYTGKDSGKGNGVFNWIFHVKGNCGIINIRIFNM